MDYRSRRELDRLLGDLKHDRDEERQRERQEQIRKAEQLYRFEATKRSILRPAMKAIQERMERRGHFTRLHEPRPQVVRLEVLMQSASPVRGTVEVELVDTSGDLVFRARRQHLRAGERRLAADEVSDSRVADVLVDLLRALTEVVEPVAQRPW